MELSLHEAGFRLMAPGSLISLVWSNSLLETLILRCVRTEFTDVGRCHGDDADWIAIACEDDDAWSRLSHVLGCPDMSSWDLR